MAKVIFKEERCKGCGHCINICPKKIISFKENFNSKGYHPAGIEDSLISECIACASCGKICPDCVITIER